MYRIYGMLSHVPDVKDRDAGIACESTGNPAVPCRLACHENGLARGGVRQRNISQKQRPSTNTRPAASLLALRLAPYAMSEIFTFGRVDGRFPAARP